MSNSSSVARITWSKGATSQAAATQGDAGAPVQPQVQETQAHSLGDSGEANIYDLSEVSYKL